MLLRKTLILFLSVAGNWLTWNEIRGDEAKPKAPIRIGSQLQLFVDHFLIDSMQGARLVLHRPQRAEVALKMDKPWEDSGPVTTRQKPRCDRSFLFGVKRIRRDTT